MHPERPTDPARADLEWLLGIDLRDLTAESGRIAGEFCEQNSLSVNELRALLFVRIADANGADLTAGELRARMGLSGAAITYLVDRMVEQGHLRRHTDSSDRRRVILRYTDHGKDVTHDFIAGLTAPNRVESLAAVPDSDLEAAHRVLRAYIAAMENARAAWGPEAGRATPA